MMTVKQAIKQGARPSWVARLLLYVGFAGTGVSLALPGSMMLWLLLHWGLRDDQAGLLLFLFFIGSALGALVVPSATVKALRWSVVRGMFCTAVGAGLLPLASKDAAFGAMMMYGFGLGITMTSVMLLQSRRVMGDAVAEMTRLNLLWALGACLAPWLMMHEGVRGGYESHVLVSIAVGFAIVGLGVVAFDRGGEVLHKTMDASDSGWRGLIALPFGLLLMVFCSAGVESSSGGWLATYTQRSGHGLNVMIGAPTCFWAGLLLSRLLHSSAVIGRVLRSFVLTWNLVLMSGAIACILMFHGGWIVVGAAFVVGFAAGPVYPLLLALVLERYQGNRIFIVAGIGSSTLPFLTGAVSSATGSLRAGLMVPCVAAAAMAIAGWGAMRRSGNGLRARSW